MIKIKLLSEEQLKDFKQWIKDKNISEGSYYVSFIKDNPINNQQQTLGGENDV